MSGRVVNTHSGIAGLHDRIPIRIGLLFCLAIMGVQTSSELINTWGPYFYSRTPDSGQIIYVGIGIIGLVFVVGRVVDVVTDPLIGFWSDRTKHRGRWRFIAIHGRRRPFIFWGSILLTLTSVAFWYPPISADSPWNAAYATVLLGFHWLFWTLCAVPLYALAPEIARSEKARVRLGTWIGLGTTLGVALAVALSGELIPGLDLAPAGELGDASPSGSSPTGYQRTGIVFALGTFIAFQIFVWGIRESGEEAVPAFDMRLREQWMLMLSNRVFLLYFALFFIFNIGYLAGQRVLPYWAEVGLGGDERSVAYVAGAFILGSLVATALMPLMSRVLSSKQLLILGLLVLSSSLPWMYPIGRLDAPYETKIVLGAILFGAAGFGQGILYIIVVPLLGAIIDHDEQRVGRRREGLFFAFHNLTWKGAQALSILLATATMARLGHSAAEPTGVLVVGPIGGLFGLVALLLAFGYPATPKSG
jgi:glycoside/pentoside/hexuronide:cation symporter, GPH family